MFPSWSHLGAINICHDVTERWKLEQRTQDALHALLTVVEALGQLPQGSGEINAQAGGRESPAPAATHLVGQRLVALTRSVLGCRHVSLTALEQETGNLRPVAVVALSPEEERQWLSEIEQFRLDDCLALALLARYASLYRRCKGFFRRPYCIVTRCSISIVHSRRERRQSSHNQLQSSLIWHLPIL
jgi:hypothetical protein